MAKIIVSRQIVSNGLKGMVEIHSNESIRKACRSISQGIELANTESFDKDLTVAHYDVKEETLIKAPCITMRPIIITACYASSKKAKTLSEWISEISKEEEIRKQA